MHSSEEEEPLPNHAEAENQIQIEEEIYGQRQEEIRSDQSSQLSRSLSSSRNELYRIQRQYRYERSLSYQPSQSTPVKEIEENNHNHQRNKRRSRSRSRNRSRDKGTFRRSNKFSADNLYRCQFQYFQNQKGELSECLLTANYVSAKNLSTILRSNLNNLPMLRKIILYRVNFDVCHKDQNSFGKISMPRRRRLGLHNIDQKQQQAQPMVGLSGMNVLNQCQLPGLRSLIIALSPMNTDDIKQLIREEQVYFQGEQQQIWNRKWPSLKTINIDNCKLNPLLMSQFCNNRWDNLQRVNLSFNKLGSQSMRYLARCNWPKLMRLELRNCGIQEGGIVALTKSNWPLLRRISLDQNQINQNGIKILIQRNFWPKISQFSNIQDIRHRQSTIVLLHLSKCNWRNLKNGPYQPDVFLPGEQEDSDYDSDEYSSASYYRRIFRHRDMLDGINNQQNQEVAELEKYFRQYYSQRIGLEDDYLPRIVQQQINQNRNRLLKINKLKDRKISIRTQIFCLLRSFFPKQFR